MRISPFQAANSLERFDGGVCSRLRLVRSVRGRGRYHLEHVEPGCRTGMGVQKLESQSAASASDGADGVMAASGGGHFAAGVGGGGGGGAAAGGDAGRGGRMFGCVSMLLRGRYCNLQTQQRRLVTVHTRRPRRWMATAAGETDRAAGEPTSCVCR